MKNPIAPPPVTSHQFYALPLSVICGHANLRPWLYSEWIQLHTFRDREDGRMHVRLYNNQNEMFFYEPLFGSIIRPKPLTNGDRIVEVCKGILADGQYIYDFVDLFYIRALRYGRHFMHDLLLFGFDDLQGVFHAYAYQGSRLAEFEIPYSDYEEAYRSEYQNSQFHCTVLYRPKAERFRPDLRRIGNHLLDYLGGINTYQREAPRSEPLYRPRFGLAVYDELAYNLDYMRTRFLRIDIPDTCCVSDHKTFMLERVLYLDGHTDAKCSAELKNRFSEIAASGKILVLLTMKLNQKGFSQTDCEALLHRFSLLKEMEKRTYTDYYEANRSVFENA